jgi:hypothetical protein
LIRPSCHFLHSKSVLDSDFCIKVSERMSQLKVKPCM